LSGRSARTITCYYYYYYCTQPFLPCEDSSIKHNNDYIPTTTATNHHHTHKTMMTALTAPEAIRANNARTERQWKAIMKARCRRALAEAGRVEALRRQLAARVAPRMNYFCKILVTYPSDNVTTNCLT
jgi:hypothetical protein